MNRAWEKKGLSPLPSPESMPKPDDDSSSDDAELTMFEVPDTGVAGGQPPVATSWRRGLGIGDGQEDGHTRDGGRREDARDGGGREDTRSSGGRGDPRADAATEGAS